MDAIQFVGNYEDYLNEIEQVVKPELLPVIEQLRQEDPHDLVKPDSWFPNEMAARGFVWTLFINQKRKN